ncbi:MAG: hypothetical protein IPH16_02320 [Haliscomenobacter sp.]|nr:hypothetical protein [Haliscomenobacter sp.]
MKKAWLTGILAFAFAAWVFSQEPETFRLTLEEVVELAQSDAPSVQLAKTRLSNFYWQFQSFRADYKPVIGVEAILPNLNRSIQSITLPSGGVSFIQQSFMSNNLGLSLRQDIGLTGGTVILNSGINRLDVFANELNPRATSFLSNPVSISLIQPILGYNALKWNKITEPLRYKEAKQAFSENMELAAYTGVQLFSIFSSPNSTLKPPRRKKSMPIPYTGFPKAGLRWGGSRRRSCCKSNSASPMPKTPSPNPP